MRKGMRFWDFLDPISVLFLVLHHSSSRTSVLQACMWPANSVTPPFPLSNCVIPHLHTHRPGVPSLETAYNGRNGKCGIIIIIVMLSFSLASHKFLLSWARIDFGQAMRLKSKLS